MNNEREQHLIEIIGKADLCELLFAAFSFPDEALTQALQDGSFADDAVTCLLDAGVSLGEAQTLRNDFKYFATKNTDDLTSELRKTYSLLYLTPGAQVPVFPYESAFRFVADGREGTPPLFRSPIALDVERHMKEAGVMPKNARTEPSDSVFEEFEFLSYLYANCAEALRQEDSSEEGLWLDRINAFCEQHVSKWLPDFMTSTKEKSNQLDLGDSYVVLASFAHRSLSTILKKVVQN